MLPTRDPTQNRRPRQTESKGLKIKVFQSNGQEKITGVAMLISDKIDFKTNVIKRNTEGHFIILKGGIHQEDINIINIYAPNLGAAKYIRKILEDFDKDIDSNILILGDFNTPLSTMDRSSKMKNINKDIVALNNALDQMDLTDICIEHFIPKKQNTHSFQMHMDFHR